MSPFEFQFPKINARNGLMEQLLKIREEADEAIEALANGEGPLRVAEELMDVLQSTETGIEKVRLDQYALNAVKAGVIAKNAERGYYDAA